MQRLKERANEIYTGYYLITSHTHTLTHTYTHTFSHLLTYVYIFLKKVINFN